MKSRLSRFWVPCFRLVAQLIAAALFSSEASAEQTLNFNRDVRPILSDHCYACHGPDKAERQGGLRFDLLSANMRGDSGRIAIVPSKPQSSELIARILSIEPDEQMPPPHAGRQLSQQQKQLLERWIAEGAEYQSHWAFTPIRRPASRGNAIDFFIQSRLDAEGLPANPAAAPETQLRRVSLDLTGLPPTIVELQQFLTDQQCLGLDVAYERAVDRLLNSPRYGERMAWQWLEAARYADTDGYQNDGPREMWRWRDWVITAYNANMPFDQFTIEQLAGDLLPQPTLEQRIATAFNRNNRYNSEEGIPIEEFLLENAVDRVDTTATVWMGLTVGCARCHDHKFDPISQKEYYQLVDYFNDVSESGRAVKFGNSEPWIKTPTDEQQAKLSALERKVRRSRNALNNAVASVMPQPQLWATEASPKPLLNNGLDFYYSFDEPDARVSSKKSELSLVPGVHGNAIEVLQSNYIEVEKIPGLIGNGRFSVAFWMKPGTVKSGPVLSSEKSDTGRAGILVEFVDGHLRWNNNTRWISGVSTIETTRTFEPGQWVHITLTNDGSQRAGGMQLYVDGIAQSVSVIRNTNSNTAPREATVPMRIGYSKHAGQWQGNLDELRFYSRRTLTANEARVLAVGESLESILAMPEAQRTKTQQALVQLACCERTSDKALVALFESLHRAEQTLVDYRDSLPTTMIMDDLPDGRPSYVRVRGVYDALGELVEPGVPQVFPALPSDQPNNRLAFARWLVSPNHPLTARVAINRYWQLLFGRGFVNTPEDFGSQGNAPSHPELMDWLAADFIESGWDVKRMMKQIVMSATYRRSSNLTGRQLEIDPENQFLARGPRVRMPGNILRDQALYVSGLLVERQFGPSVFPYQPSGLWEEASNAKYTQGKNEDLVRRSLYTYWKRTLAPPSMAVLDTGDREYCTVRPKFTNTPLQALTLMNETTFVEAARKLAERMLLEGGNDEVQRITFLFRCLTSRQPSSDELRLLCKALENYRNEFALKPEAAESSLKIGDSKANSALPVVELAAATALANMLLNLDEVNTRE